ncbi:protein obstructor-E [Condylostylus longicornis]|uniref:protein obstructor-E n=1 Tax=Condylostylus longicornis TaxID=2530218 RepID=UPI00244DF238|nr:protein obstructor-E [Condylostylus longicornis]XP_055381960.1 protein obstructor-E [Condylostylus longicornis]
MFHLRTVILTLVLGLVIGQQQPPRRPGLRKVTKRVTTTTTPSPPPIHISENSDDDDGTSEDCPEPNGYFADAEQCDKYYACNEGVITEKLCPDGMVFNDFSIDQEKCDLPYNIDCSQRPKLQTPQPTLNCPRLNGYFGHENKNICDKFFYCVDGKFNMIVCPSGLVFNPKTGICTWADEAGRTGCSSEDVFQFTCPKVNETEAATHPRYADPDDCQYFYVCINGETPRRNGCKLGQVFDDEHKKCEWSRKVPECADWYKDKLTDAELDELENPKPKKPKTKGPSNRRKQPKAKIVVVEEDEEAEE